MLYTVRSVMRSFEVEAESLEEAEAKVRKDPGEGKGLAPFQISGPDGERSFELDLGGCPSLTRWERGSRARSRS